MLSRRSFFTELLWFSFVFPQKYLMTQIIKLKPQISDKNNFIARKLHIYDKYSNLLEIN